MRKNLGVALATALAISGSAVAVAPASQAVPMGACYYSSSTPIVGPGYATRGPAVSQLQCMLRRSGVASARGLVVDGQFGPATYRAVRDFQVRYGLSADGIAGPRTWTKLYQVVSL